MQLLSTFMARHLKRGASLKKGKREVVGGGSPVKTSSASGIASNKSLNGVSACGTAGGSANMTLNDPAPDDEFALAIAQKTQRDAEAIRGALYLGLALTIAWIIGAVGLSLAWLVLVLALVGTIVKARISRLLQTALHNELARLRRRRALYKDETAEWLSLLLNKWWRFSAASIFSLAKERLEPLLNEAKPGILGPLELRELTLGEQTPYVTRVRTLDYSCEDETLDGHSGERKLSIEADVRLDCEQFRMLIASRLFGKGVGMDVDMAVEKLSLSGTILATLTLNSLAPFPHATSLSVSFLEKPDVWFSVRILRAVQMMEMPLIKTWIHAVVTDALASWLVDPGHLELNLRAQERPGPGLDSLSNSIPQGVLTVVLSQNCSAPIIGDEVRWLVVTIGDQRRVTSHLSPTWTEDVSFLVGSLENERITIKLKTKRLVSTITLAQFELALGVYNWENSQVVETVLQQKKPSRSSSNIPNINARLEYTPIPNLDPNLPRPELTDDMLHNAVPRKYFSRTQKSGVLVVYIHSAENLNCDNSQCNPYCMLFNNRKKVKTTHYIRNTISPHWECRAQFLVQDYTQVCLSFVIYSWNISKSCDSDMLGLAMMSLSQDSTWVLRKELTLNGTNSVSTMTVSVLFYPVKSVQQVVTSRRSSMVPVGSDDEPKSKRNSLPWMQQAKLLLTHKDVDPASSDISSLLSTGSGLMEVTLLRAKDLVAKDLNGFSDPFCELKLNNETKYKSSIKKKTLNPCWDESSIMGLPRSGESLDIVLWDHDTFGMKDYLGKVSLTLEDIRKLSNSDQSHWFTLKGTKTGSVELKIKVLSEECETQSTYAASNVSEGSSRYNIETESISNIIRRPSMEKSKMKLHLDPVIPPPPPPRTVTLIKPTTSNQSDKTSTTSKDSIEINGTQNSWIPRVANESITDVVVDEADAPKIRERRSSHHSLTPSPEQNFGKKLPQYNSFRVMKQKVKRGLKLRRFRSEVNIEDNKNESKGITLSLEPRGGGEADATELLQGAGLAHAVSQPDMLGRIRQPSPRLRLRPNELKIVNGTRERYSGVEGKVLQAQGLHVAHIAQLYCRVKFQTCNSPDKMSSSANAGKTIAKSRLLPAMPNPQFSIDFHIESDSVPRQALLIFEIRGASKELLASRRITLHELLVSAANNEVHTWLALNNGASLEIQIAHGRELKNKSSKKLFRSWSVHRIGKI
ncbi:PREDICTED: extended synaptotagmin-2-B isoform X4 [Polistes dominula]|uniref:Extended synaptotagmin-2-B isoform X4 n=1 Tax=Polistes dominula TaxID=743375 RepID=A0ABM1JEL0_POLDO|nr:PREDICTED: extended synaptotagmin-2-B isoform X4 [Polistes dominula]